MTFLIASSNLLMSSDLGERSCSSCNSASFLSGVGFRNFNVCFAGEASESWYPTIAETSADTMLTPPQIAATHVATINTVGEIKDTLPPC